MSFVTFTKAVTGVLVALLKVINIWVLICTHIIYWNVHWYVDIKELICTLLEKKLWNPAQNTIENVMDLMVIMGIVLVLMETMMVSTGMWWILFEFNPIGKMPKTHYKKEFCNGFTGKS